MNATLLAFLLRRGRTGTLLAVLGLGLFEWVLAGFYAKTRPDQNMAQLLELIPAPMRGLLGSDYLSITSESGFLAMGFAHPLALLLLSALAILNASRLAGDIETRTIDLLLSQPLSRSSLILSHAAVGLIVALLAGLSAFTGHRLGVATFPLPEPIDATPFLLVSTNLALFVLAIHALSLFAATLASRRTTAVGIAVGTIALMLFLRLAGELWDAFRIPAHLSFFTYYVPGRVVFARALEPQDLVALLATTIALHLAALLAFARRDLS